MKNEKGNILLEFKAICYWR